MNTKETSWGGVADWYDELLEESADSFQAKVILPNLSRILANGKEADKKSAMPLAGMKILDIACGQGFFSRVFAQAGAQVAAADISQELVAKAAEKSKASKDKNVPAYHVAPADALRFAADSSFDAATIVLAIQNIENLAGTVAEAARTLKLGGRFILVLNHPAYRIPQSSSWGWDDAAQKQYRRIDAYMSDARLAIDMTPGERDARRKKSTVSFHRPLQSYFKVLNKSGFTVARLEEWISHRKSQNGPRGAEEDRIRKEIPMFLMLEAVKK